MSGLTFQEEGHNYCWDGVVVPSVTEIICEWRTIAVMGTNYLVNSFTNTVLTPSMFVEAADHGRAVHKAVKFRLQGRLDMARLHPEILPSIVAFDRWVQEFKVKPIFIEQPLYSRKYGFAGTPDIITCILRRNIPIVCDVKTGDIGSVAAQTAAYEELYREASGRGKTPLPRYVLHLPKGEDKFTFKQIGSHSDWHFFQSRLHQYNYLRR